MLASLLMPHAKKMSLFRHACALFPSYIESRRAMVFCRADKACAHVKLKKTSQPRIILRFSSHFHRYSQRVCTQTPDNQSLLLRHGR